MSDFDEWLDGFDSVRTSHIPKLHSLRQRTVAILVEETCCFHQVLVDSNAMGAAVTTAARFTVSRGSHSYPFASTALSCLC